MKKLMIAAAIVSAAALAQAASINWTTGGLQYGGANVPSGGAVGYMWVVNDLSSYTSYTDGEALTKAIYGAYGDKLAEATGPAGTLSGKKGALTLTDGVTSYGDGSVLSAIILYKTTQGGEDYWMGNYGTISLSSAQDAEITNMGKSIGGFGEGVSTATANATAWATVAVPEPTSGLLLLLGMAGLALRRRRA